MSGTGAKESQVGASRVRYSTRQTVLIVDLLTPIAVHDLPALTRSITHNAKIAQTQRTLLDLRASHDRDRTFRDAFTEWAVSGELPLVLVVGDELHVAEINMASLARGGLVRAFTSSTDAFRHAARTSNKAAASEEGGRQTLNPDERRALLFPRRPSEVAFPRARRQTGEMAASGGETTTSGEGDEG